MVPCVREDAPEMSRHCPLGLLWWGVVTEYVSWLAMIMRGCKLLSTIVQ